ncbi:MAG: hypothetical protein ACFB16_11930 [Phormidesmis sp.]
MVNPLSASTIAKQGCNASLFSEARTNPFERIQQPVFLVGSERSGIRLLRLMLDHHPNIGFWAGFEYAVERIDSAGNYPELVDYYRWLQTDSSFMMDRQSIDRRMNYPELVNSY